MIVGFQGGSTPNPRNHPHRGGEGAGLQACTIYMYILYIYIYIYVPRKAVVEVSKIGNL